MKAAHTIESSTGLNKKTGAILVLLAFTLIAMIVGYFLVNQVQNPAKRADEGDKGISLSGPNCPANGFICSWTREPGVSYHYTIKDGGGAVVKEGDIPASSSTDKITVTHTPESGKTYSCNVVATNDCGTATDEKSAACSSSPQPSLMPSTTPSPTPTLTLTPTGTISPTLSPTVTPLISLSVTPTSVLSSTPSPTLPPNVTPTKTPTPTDIVIVNTTNTPNPSQPTSSPKATTNPTLPVSGGLPSLPMLTILLIGFGIVTLGLIL